MLIQIKARAPLLLQSGLSGRELRDVPKSDRADYSIGKENEAECSLNSVRLLMSDACRLKTK
jgi:hypothetical protein